MTDLKFNEDGAVYELQGRYCGRSTLFPDRLGGVNQIILTNGSQQAGDALRLHVNGDTKGAAVSTFEFDVTKVTVVAYADLKGGLIRSGSNSQNDQGEVTVTVIIDAEIPESSMGRALITATEGVTAVIQDLVLRYDSIFASGSVNQNLTILSKEDCSLRLRGTGNHCKLGELIGKSVIEAVRESAKKNGVRAEDRKSIRTLMSEYGCIKDGPLAMHDSEDDSVIKDSDGKVLSSVSAVLHIIDCMKWGLIPEAEGTKAGADIIRVTFGSCRDSGSLLDRLEAAVSSYLAGQ